MAQQSDSLDGPLNWFPALMGWILPGMGQVLLGHRQRGFRAMGGVLGIFLAGVLVGGVDCVDRREDALWFYAQAGAGPVAFAADWANSALLKTGKVGQLIPSPPSNPRLPPPQVTSFKTVTMSNEIGTLFCFAAGLMNIVVILDALRRQPANPKEWNA